VTLNWILNAHPNVDSATPRGIMKLNTPSTLSANVWNINTRSGIVADFRLSAVISDNYAFRNIE
jgi:hypothetical protein